MPGIVKCDICGQISNESYINSHKRLAHRHAAQRTEPTQTEPEMLKAILDLYGQLSEENKRVVRGYVLGHSLAAAEIH
jgi:hypothetical protein